MTKTRMIGNHPQLLFLSKSLTKQHIRHKIVNNHEVYFSTASNKLVSIHETSENLILVQMHMLHMSIITS